MTTQGLLPSSREGATKTRLVTTALRRPDPDAEEFSVPELWHIIRKRKRTILLSAGICTALAIVGSLLMTTKYESVATVEVNRENSDVLGLNPNDQIGLNSDSLEETVTLETEANALQSASLAFQVVDQLELERRKEFRLVPGLFDDYEKIKEEYKFPLEKAPVRRRKVFKTFQKNLKIKTIGGTRLIEVHFLSPDPQVAADVANLLVKNLQEQGFRNRYAATAQVSDWLSKELSDLKSQVASSQEHLNQIQREAGILGSDETNNIVMEKLGDLNRQLTEAESNRILKEAVYKLTKSADPETISSIAGSSLTGNGSINPNAMSLIDTLRAQQAELKVQYAQASAKFGSAYPQVKQLRNQLAQLDESIQTEITKLAARAENDYLAAKRSEDLLRASFQAQKAEANRLNDKAVQYTIMKQDVESGRRLYDDLLGKLKEGGVLAGLHSTNIVLLDPARTSASPARPIYLLNIGIGLAAGLFGGIALAFLREGLDNTLYTPEDVETTATLPCVGIVPELASCTEIPRQLRKTAIDISALSVAVPGSRLAESYRSIRTWIFHSDPERAPRVLTITSALPREGKTTTSLNTAITLAQDGAKVLVMEADLRRPSFQNTVDGNTNGLVGLLTNPDACKYEFLSYPGISNLFVLPAGLKTTNPAELLGSDRMKRFVQFLRTKFDFIVIDTPPILSFTDAAIVSRYSDAVLFVVRSQHTSKQSCIRARDVLERANVQISGVLINGANVNSADYDYYYGYSSGKYSSYYQDVELRQQA